MQPRHTAKLADGSHTRSVVNKHVSCTRDAGLRREASDLLGLAVLVPHPPQDSGLDITYLTWKRSSSPLLISDQDDGWLLSCILHVCMHIQ